MESLAATATATKAETKMRADRLLRYVWGWLKLLGKLLQGRPGKRPAPRTYTHSCPGCGQSFTRSKPWRTCSPRCRQRIRRQRRNAQTVKRVEAIIEASEADERKSRIKALASADEEPGWCSDAGACIDPRCERCSAMCDWLERHGMTGVTAGVTAGVTPTAQVLQPQPPGCPEPPGEFQLGHPGPSPFRFHPISGLPRRRIDRLIHGDD